MERARAGKEAQQFPALPPLDAVRESPLEDADDADGKMRAILLADEALRRAQVCPCPSFPRHHLGLGGCCQCTRAPSPIVSERTRSD